ncbi:Translation protein SH3-like domain containing protein [Amanita muscaria]
MADVEATQSSLPPASDTIIDDGEEAETKEIMLMKQRVEEMEREAKKLRELQAAAEQANGSSGGETDVANDQGEDRSAADGRSVYVGNVDYGATPEEIQGHFQACGVINRVTILCDKFTGHPKGYAYVEFAEPDHIDAAVALDNSLFRGRLIKVGLLQSEPTYLVSTGDAVAVVVDIEVATVVIKVIVRIAGVVAALMPPPTHIENAKALRVGKGLIQHLRETLPPPNKQAMIRKFFSRRSPDCLLPGSIVTVTLEHAPNTFTGVLLGIRRRGPDSSFVLRNIVQRTGVEMQFFATSPHLKEIKVVKRPPKGRMRKAKLYYLRDSPEKMSTIAGSR